MIDYAKLDVRWLDHMARSSEYHRKGLIETAKRELGRAERGHAISERNWLNAKESLRKKWMFMLVSGRFEYFYHGFMVWYVCMKSRSMIRKYRKGIDDFLNLMAKYESEAKSSKS